MASYLIRGEVDTLVKFNEVVFWFSFIPVIFVLLFAFYQGDFTNLLPVLQNKPSSYITATWATINRFKGIEIIFLLLPFMKKNKTSKILFNSLFLSGFLYFSSNFICNYVFNRTGEINALARNNHDKINRYTRYIY